MNLRPNLDLLESLREEEFLYCPNPGNAGDSLIACASYLAFERAGCRYQTIAIDTPARDTRGRIVVFGGGGNLVGMYANARNFIARHHAGAKRLVVLPHTIRQHEDLLAQLGGNVHLVCRDEVSLRHAMGAARNASVSFGHDMALLLDPAELLRLGAQHAGWTFRSPELLLRSFKRSARVLGHAWRNRSEPTVLHAFRRDSERTGIPILPLNLDVSQGFAASSMGREASLHTVFALIRFLRRFSEVRTDRLHVAILAGLLGTRVQLHDNSYGKNGDVYRSSLRELLPTVSYHVPQASATAVLSHT